MKRKNALFALIIAVTVAAAGCSQTPGSETGTDNVAEQDLTVAFVTHGSPGDAFWDVVKSGAEQAGSDLGVHVTYQSAGDAAAQSQLIDAAAASKPQGLVVSLANADGVKTAVQAAVASGIPTVATNKGGSHDEWKQYGMDTYVGQSEFSSGQAVGTRLKQEGVTRAICVIHEVGNVGMEDRCRGVADTLGGKLINLQVDQANLGDAQSTIGSALVADPDIDGVVTLNSPITVAAAAGIAETDRKVELGAFELSPQVLDLITAGKVAFTVDQQPYLQGYLPVVFLAQRLRNGTTVGGGMPVYTGPDFVTKANVAAVLQYAEKGTR